MDISYTHRNSHPLETIIDFAWASGADRFWVNNAKDELKKLKQELEELRSIMQNPVAWARINQHGDLFDLRISRNPYIENIIPLYANTNTKISV